MFCSAHSSDGDLFTYVHESASNHFHALSESLTHPHGAGRCYQMCLCDMCMVMWLSEVMEVFDRAVSEQHVLVVYGPLATPLRLQLIVRVPLRDVGVGVAKQGSPPHRFTPTQRCGDWWRRIGGGVGASEWVVPRLENRAGTGGGAGGAGGRGLTGAACQAAVSQAGLRAPPMEGERDEESAWELTWGRKSRIEFWWLQLPHHSAADLLAQQHKIRSFLYK